MSKTTISVLHETQKELLDKFLSSRGINPKYATKIARISHAKTYAFQQWARTQMNTTQSNVKTQEETELNEDVLDEDKNYGDIATKIFHKNKLTDHSSLEAVRQGIKHHTSKPGYTASSLSDHVSKILDKRMRNSGNYNELSRFKEAMRQSLQHHVKEGLDEARTPVAVRIQKALEKHNQKRQASIQRGKELLSPKKDDKVPEKKPDVREEVDQTPSHRTPEALAKKHGVSLAQIKKQLKLGAKTEHEHTKDDKLAEKIATDHVEEIPDYYSRLKKMEKGQCDEAVFRDEMPLKYDSPEGTLVREKRSELSKSARMIKAIYKKHRVNEDMNDTDVQDKQPATYGKKPTMQKVDAEKSKADDKPEAAATLTGGTTLTGQKRDDVELDPMMRNRPGQPDITKKKGEGNKPVSGSATDGANVITKNQ